MRRGIAEAERLWPETGIRISAQAYLLNFYGKLGFMAVSEPYDEDGIPHVEMVRPGKNTGAVQ
jgi:ElaA protein